MIVQTKAFTKALAGKAQSCLAANNSACMPSPKLPSATSAAI
ncbi:hypothetical protein [Snodgrassella gandavensis]|nr:hypothetical protein [Snodgrassella gandavensis]